MGAQGSTTIDFGAFPGKSDVSKDVAATGVTSSALVEAWLHPAATADHSIDEHLVESIRVIGYFKSNDVITIFGRNDNNLFESPPGLYAAGYPTNQGRGTRLYGLWTVAWVWN